MTMNSRMNEAGEWAAHMASLGRLVHASSEERNGDGENIYYGCGMSVTVGSVTTEW